ncbi:MAG: hypothetical protein IH586_24045, partial [Anaerolineaceae bacterium]|nr:hypothetical protein [Anaerolineaceae bacterium]
RVFLPAARYEASGTCPGCGEMLLNGGFEAGKTSWVEVGVDIIDNRSYPNLPIAPYAGDWLAWLGGRNNAADRLYQDFRVPSGLSSARLRYVTYMSSAETSGIYDWMLVRLRTTSGTLIKELDGIDNAFVPKNQWVVREMVVPELTMYQGQNLRISFEGDTDGSSVSSFYVDEVSFQAIPPN